MSMHVDVAVIGAGQAGLAMGYHLRGQRRRFVILDGADEVGASWRRRWTSLKLFTPARYDGLPGMPFPGRPGRHPGKDEVADYLRDYATAFDLPVWLGCAVTALSTDDRFKVDTADGVVLAEQVVVATGPYQAARIPEAASGLADRVVSLHSSGYRDPDQLPGRTIAVVGSGNSGAQIAAELAAHGRRVHLCGRELPQLPQRFLGADLFRWFDRLGVLRLSADSRRGRRMRGREAVIGTDLRALQRAGSITRAAMVAHADGDELRLDDGGALTVDGVVWATGYRPHLPWLDPELLDPQGAPRHERGRMPVDGLYVLGLPWQTHRSSALLAGVGRDATMLASRLRAGPPR